MRAALVGFTLGGLAGGLIAGLYDGLAAGGGGRVVLGTVGLHLALGTLLGLLCGLAAPLVPRGLGLADLLRRLARRLWPGPEDALHERCEVGATLATGLAFMLAAVWMLTRLGAVLLARIQSPDFAALGLTLLALMVLILGLAVAAPVRAALARGMEFAVRRWPRLTALSHPLVAVAAAALYLGYLFGRAVMVQAETWAALDLRPAVAVGLLLAVALTAGALLRLRAHTLRHGASIALIAGVVGPAVGAGALASSLGHPQARFALGERTASTRLALGLLRAPFDGDDDGFADALGGGDCDDAVAEVHPGATEIAGNGVDEDCDGADLSPAETRQEDPPDPPPTSEQALRPPYSLVLVTIDSLRADHVGAYGYPRPTTPVLDALAAESVVFRNAYSPSSKTPTAIPALLAGRYPSELRRDDKHFSSYAGENVFFPEVLRDRGYATAGFHGHWYFRPGFGLDQGFGRWWAYTDPGARMEQVPTAGPVIDQALDALPELRHPYLLWLHLLDPHKDYIDHEGVERFGSAPVDRYDHEVRYCDQQLGRLLAALAARPDRDRTVLVVTSDHGEAFGEHGYDFHGFGLHEHQLRVPLVVRVPGLGPRSVETRVSLIDLAPTFLQLADVKADDRARTALGLRGASLVPLLTGEPAPERPIYAEMPAGPFNKARAALLVDSWKLHHQLEGDFFQLFDLSADPGEQQDLLETRPVEAERLRTALARFRAQGLESRAPRSQ